MGHPSVAKPAGDDVVALEDPPMDDMGTDLTNVGSPLHQRAEVQKVSFVWGMEVTQR